MMLGIVKEQAASRYAAAERSRLVRQAKQARSRNAGDHHPRGPITIRRHPVRVLLALAGGHGLIRR